MLNETIADNRDLWDIVCNYSYKYFDTRILEKIHRLLQEKISHLELVKRLIGYYSFTSDKYK